MRPRLRARNSAAGQSLALRGDGVRGFPGLRDHHHDRIDGGVRGPVAVFARIFHIDGYAGKIFNHDFARQSRMAARPAGGDDQFFKGQQSALDGIEFAGEENVVLQVLVDSFRDGARLLVDLPAHGVRKGIDRSVGFGLCWIHHRLRLRVNHLPRPEQTGRDVLEQSGAHLLRFAAFRCGGIMRNYFACACIAGLTSFALAQQPVTPAKTGENQPSSAATAESKLKDMFEAKIKVEWEALKHKDKKAYAELLADDYQGVEADGRGERNKIQAVNELAETNVFNYTLFGFKLIPAGPDTTLVIYEVTMQFPPKAQVRYSRVYISSLWSKRAGEWKEVHYQETNVK